MNILIAGSVLLCIAISLMWCRGYFRRDRLIYTRRAPSGTWVLQYTFTLGGAPLSVAKAVEALSIGSGDGRIVLTQIGFVIPRGQRMLQPGEAEPDYAHDVPYIGATPARFALEHPDNPRWVSGGFPSGRFGFTRTDTAWELSFGYWQAPAWMVRAREYEIPYWFVLLVSSIAPAARGIGILRRRRLIRSGRCAACGYDLRASPQRCPECGGTFSAAPDAARAAR